MKKLIFCLIFCLLAACQKESPGTAESASPQTAARLSETVHLGKIIVKGPSALLSVNSDIDIVFNRDMVTENRTGLVLSENPFLFKPQLKGQALWASRNTLRFEPDEALPPATTYEAVLDGKKLMGEQQEADNYTFRFKILEQEVISLEGDFEVYEQGKNKVQFVGTLTFAQPVEPDKIRKDLRFRGPSGKIGLTLETGDSPRICRIKSEPLTRTQKGQRFTFQLDKAYTADRKRWEKIYFLPPVEMFKVLTHMDMSDPESQTRVYGFRFHYARTSGHTHHPTPEQNPSDRGRFHSG